jgi:hypothetical protein
VERVVKELLKSEGEAEEEAQKREPEGFGHDEAEGIP